LQGYAAVMDATTVERIRLDARVRYVSPDVEIQAIKPPVTNYCCPADFTIPKQVAPKGVRLIGASTNGYYQTLANDGDGVGVAVLDTGIQLDHPDLKPVVDAKSCVSYTASANDDLGHGTHVAGTIAARDNAIGVVGVAPGASLYAVKVLDQSGNS